MSRAEDNEVWGRATEDLMESMKEARRSDRIQDLFTLERAGLA